MDIFGRFAVSIIVFAVIALSLILFRPRKWIAGLMVGLAVVVPLWLLIAPALAAESAGASSATVFHVPQTLWDELNQIIIGTIVALAVLAFKWIDARSPLKNTQAEQIFRDAFTGLLDKGAQYGLTQLQSAEKKVGDMDVGNAAVAAGANFVIAQGPDLAKKLGFDVTTPEGQQAIVRSVALRVATITGAAGASGFVQPSQLSIPAAAAPVAPPAKS